MTSATMMTVDPPGQPPQQSNSGSFYLNPNHQFHNQFMTMNGNGNGASDLHVTTGLGGGGGGGNNAQEPTRGEPNKQQNVTATDNNIVVDDGGKSTSASLKKGRSGRKRGGSQRSHNKNNTSSNSYNEDYFNEMPTALGGGGGAGAGAYDMDRINQLMARFAVNGGGVQQQQQPPMAAYNMFAGYPKGDDLMDHPLMTIDGGTRKGYGSPFGDTHNWNRSSTGASAGLPHPMMMMMPGQQNLMTNYFTPGLMMKTPPSSSNGHYMNTDFSSLPPAINMSHNPLLLMEDAVDGDGGGGGRGHSLSEKLRFSSDPGASDNENVSFSGERATAAAATGGGGANRGKNNSNSSKRVPGGSGGQSNESTSSSVSSARTGVSGGSLSETHHHQQQQHRQQRSRSSRSTGPSMGEQQQSGRILGTLLEQINLLHETNSKICRNLHDTKVEIEALKHAPSWGLRHRRDSISGLSTHSQPLGYAFGTQSPAPASFHSGAYTPGMMTDVVREVREGARVREDAMLNRVKTLVDERTWQANELNFKLQREVEELKGHVQELRKERQETSHRMSEMELEIKTMRIVFGAQLQALGGSAGVANGNINHMSIAQQVAASLRNTSSSSRNHHNHSDSMDRQQLQPNESTPISSRSTTRNHLNIKYGVLNEQESPLEVLPGGGGGVDKEAQEMELMEKLCAKYNYGKNSIKTNGNGTAAAVQVTEAAAVDRDSESQVVVQMERDTFDLRRELQDAVAGKKSAEQRIVTLEKEMQNMQAESIGRRRTSEPIKLNQFSRSETVLNNNNIKFFGTNGGGAEMKPTKAQQANSVQTLVVGREVVAASPPPPKTNGFCLTGPVTDL